MNDASYTFKQTTPHPLDPLHYQRMERGGVGRVTSSAPSPPPGVSDMHVKWVGDSHAYTSLMVTGLCALCFSGSNDTLNPSVAFLTLKQQLIEKGGNGGLAA